MRDAFALRAGSSVSTQFLKLGVLVFHESPFVTCWDIRSGSVRFATSRDLRAGAAQEDRAVRAEYRRNPALGDSRWDTTRIQRWHERSPICVSVNGGVGLGT